MRNAIDTETTWKNCRNIPFIATDCNSKMKGKLYDLSKRSDKKKLKKVCSTDVDKVFHNAPYDITCLKNIGIEVKPPYHDTMVQASLVNENFESKKLKQLAKIYLNEKCKEDKELSNVKRKLKAEAKKQGKEFSYDMIPPKVLYPYAKKDANYTIRLDKKFITQLKWYMAVYNLEMSLIPIIVDMQYTGIRVDRAFVKKMLDQYILEQQDVYRQMAKMIKKLGIVFSKTKTYKRYPRKAEAWDEIVEQKDGTFFATKYIAFKPNSGPHLVAILKKLQVPIMHGTATKELATDAKTLKPFAEQFPFIKLLLRYMFLFKQIGTYYGPLLEWYTSPKHDRAHFGFYQTGAKSGRFSAELIQTIPRKDEEKEQADQRVIRNAFIPSKGCYFAAIDYDQIEMRLFAHFSKCEPLIEGILAGMDPHDSTALTLFGKRARKLLKKIDILKSRKPTDAVKSKLAKLKAKFKGLRRMAKGINFGIIYGMGQAKLAASLGLPTIEAIEILRDYYRKYPVREFMKSTESTLYRNGFVSVTLESPLMQIHRDYRVPKELAYKAVNILIQGCLDGDSKVYTKEYGYISLREISGKNVTIWDGSRYVKASCLPSGKKKKTIMKFSSGNSIICSRDHKFLINGQWVPASKIKYNDEVSITNPVKLNNKKYIIIDDIKYKRTTPHKKYINNKNISDVDFGVLLGRLYTDGSYGVRHGGGGSGAIWFIAEHEYDILPYMKKNISKLCSPHKPRVIHKPLRPNRNERMSTISICSVDLARKVECIKKEIPNWMWNNREILRGYLRGMFDGDGGITGVTVVSTFGKKVSIDYVKQVQQALLMFGVRTRIVHYKNYCTRLIVLNRDTEKFMDEIGFLSKKKILRLKEIVHKPKRKYEMKNGIDNVSSIEHTNKMIEMYDIVNSESGQYMANGLVTHNTAAYVMKCGMVRCYNWIKKNAPDIKLLVTVHDELIFDIPKKYKPEYIIPILSDLMADNETFAVPIIASPKMSDKSWGDCKDF